jgi:hypothetical protein
MLRHLPYDIGVPTRQISAENPTGGKGEACSWIPDPTSPMLPHSRGALKLGKGWKVRPFIKIVPGETVLLAYIEGPGSIEEFFITTDHHKLSNLILRIYWDNNENPSVESQLGAFFAMGHDLYPHAVSSLPVQVCPRAGLNCYWHMPFRRSARITLTYNGDSDIGLIAYRVLYKLHKITEDAAYFHAQFRHAVTNIQRPIYTILDNVKGIGSYVGTYLAWTALNTDWWGEGEVKFYLDGDTEQPTMADNGTEDYFGGSFGFSPFGSDACWNEEVPFSYPYLGMPLAKLDTKDTPRKYSLYRWHIQDSIGFSSDIRVEVQTLGLRNGYYDPLSADIASVAYWYQAE